MLAVFRCDASGSIGTGHVMRCLTLALALREQGAQVEFICRLHPGHLCDLLARRDFVVHRLPLVIDMAAESAHPSGESGAPGAPAHAAWLGCSWQTDAHACAAILSHYPQAPDWLIIDHYALDAHWQQALQNQVRHIMVIDDLADRPHAAHLLLDQNLWPDMHTRYQAHVSATCTCLLGPKYALLQAQYASLREQYRASFPRPNFPRRWFAFFGGADLANLSMTALQAFLALQRPDLQLDLVLPGANHHWPEIEALAAGHDNVSLYRNLPSLAPLMAQADCALGAGGATTWERLCLALPSLVVTVAQNQEASASEQARLGLIHYLGPVEQVSADSLAATLRAVLQEGVARWVQADLSQWVDGLGVQRVLERMNSISSNSIHSNSINLPSQ